MNIGTVTSAPIQQAYSTAQTQARPVSRGGDGDRDDGAKAAAMAQKTAQAPTSGVSGKLDIRI